ncbi:hypothetical protein KPG66_15360 [Mycetohabitans sp. B2]|uniref:hypothetical protein n=1 Tax=Mycetohabitans TaxID=2571159 RepID=UPI001F3DAECC|nr:hypothetical protein [Mycetohabitans sp. B2]MCF7697363.1 hypothetical protein [Mycetohabitans sp. B2]
MLAYSIVGDGAAKGADRGGGIVLRAAADLIADHFPFDSTHFKEHCSPRTVLVQAFQHVSLAKGHDV